MIHDYHDVAPGRPVTTTPANWSALAPHKFLERASVVHAKKTAVVDGDRSFTYAEWYDRALKFARMLSARGVGPRKRVALSAKTARQLAFDGVCAHSVRQLV